MRAREILSIAAGIVAIAAARPAAAQRAERTLATYAVSSGRHGGPLRLTVADSAGALVGRMWLKGDANARPVAVSVEGADLVLRADTPKGAAEFVLYRQNERRAGAVFGRWTIGAQQGELRGSVKGA